jgi:hypothetical protein
MDSSCIPNSAKVVNSLVDIFGDIELIPVDFDIESK